MALSLFALVALGLSVLPDSRSEELPVSIIPEPVQLERLSGSFRLTKDTRIAASQHESGVYGVAVYLADCLAKGLEDKPGITLTDNQAPPRNAIVLTTRGADPTLGDEGYELRVGPDGILLRAPTDTGLSRGVQTIRQLLVPEFETGKKRANWELPAVRVRDWPRFKWRGMLLDCCRHFMDKEFVKRAIDLLAYHKMNVLHWHLTEDQGWRIEIKKYPKLTEVGAFRRATPNDMSSPSMKDEPMLPPPSGYAKDPGAYRVEGKYGGYYTQEDIKEVLAYAKIRHITVVPEIEMPGHSLAALACYPELSCTGGPFEVGTEWGVYPDIYCAGNEKVFQFVEDVLSEVIDLFPSAYIHIGGDEAPKTRWNVCPKCQARIKQEGLKDSHELQSWFIRRVEAFLNGRGKHLIGWDEILEGGLSPNATVQSWRGMQGGIDAAKQGHDVIMSPTSHCYLDAGNEGTTLQKVYQFEPVPPDLTPDQAKHVLGGEGNVWTERIPQERFDRMAFPRLVALSEVFWSPRDKRNYEDFTRRMGPEMVRLDAMGVRYYLPTPRLADRPTVFTATAEIVFEKPAEGADIVYTLDGTAPNARSRKVDGPIFISQTVTIRAATLWHGKSLSEEVRRTFEKQVPMEPMPRPAGLEPGLNYRYFEGNWTKVPDFAALTPKTTGTAKRIGLEPRLRDEEIGLEFTGFIDAPADGIYTFYLESDDGSLLWINGKKVVDNDGAHPAVEVAGQIALRRGLHVIKVEFVQGAGGLALGLKWRTPGNGKVATDAALFKSR